MVWSKQDFPLGRQHRKAQSSRSRALMLEKVGVLGVFVFIGCAMTVDMLAIGLMRPITRGLELEKLSHQS